MHAEINILIGISLREKLRHSLIEAGRGKDTGEVQAGLVDGGLETAKEKRLLLVKQGASSQNTKSELHYFSQLENKMNYYI